MTRVLPVLMVALAMGAPTEAAGAGQSAWGRMDSLASGRSVVGPAGWLNWCMADMARCAPAGSADPVPATRELLHLLDRVQAQVNDAIRPEAEPQGRDLWQTGAGRGDCEDYALAKQQRLRDLGLPAGATRLATARLRSGELHAVLTVETDRGTLVLDNLQRGVVPMNSLAYDWQRAQGADGTLQWRELRTAPAAAAAYATAATARPAAAGDSTGLVAQ